MKRHDSAANKGQMEAISEIALNLLKGSMLIPAPSFKRLKPHKSKLLYLSRKKPSLKKKKQCSIKREDFYWLSPL